MLSREEIEIIEEILKKGNKVELVKNKNGVLILEVTKKIKSGK